MDFLTKFNPQLRPWLSSMMGVRMARAHNPEIIEDLLQEGRIALVRAERTLPPGASEVRWARRCVQNAVISALRKEARHEKAVSTADLSYVAM